MVSKKELVKSKRDLVRSTVKLVIVVVVLGILYYVLPNIPGIGDIPLPGRLRAEEVGRLVVAIVALLAVLQYGKSISGPIRNLAKFPKAGEISKDIIFLITTAIAYKAFIDIAKAYIYKHMWVYSLIFIVIGVFLAIRILRNLMGSVDTITDKIIGENE